MGCDATEKYEKKIEELESKLRQAQDVADEKRSDSGLINMAFAVIDRCQGELYGRHVCGPESCHIDRRTLSPEESNMFGAACDMLSRIFDGSFRIELGPEGSSHPETSMEEEE